ncbi:MAG: YebC/PmpR family DNA-binding transcriptional regulator [Deltaproteobacteria bacterium]|nr:YebC/PmpR family DNA-binding transcriptional regulator [Deltaproteobacteria bacterium]
MSGHSKWSTIKHKKGAADARRGKIFSKIIKEITVAARIGGGDLTGNSRLRSAVAAAKAENMPKDNIDRAIKKGTGEIEGVTYEESTYEGYGPGGAAVLVEIMTDNKNRTVADIRHIFAKHSGNLGEAGCVSWMFDKKGLFVFDKKTVGEDQLMEMALDAGAEDVTAENGEFEVVCSPESYEAIKEIFDNQSLKYEMAQVTMVPRTTVELTGKQAEQMLKMMEKLEDHDDVQNVYSNFDISDEEMEALGQN